MMPYRRMLSRLILCLGLSFQMLTCTQPVFAEGTAYKTAIQASLSCYVNAMGGVEFGAPLLTEAYSYEENGKLYITLYFTKSQVTIYGITCDTFIDATPTYVTNDRGVRSGTIGFYRTDGSLDTENITYTLSSDVALNPSDEQVHYVDSVTFSPEGKTNVYNLTFYINSNVMGVQFTNANAAATATTYPAILQVSWTEAQPETSAVPQTEPAAVATSSQTEVATTAQTTSASSQSEPSSASLPSSSNAQAEDNSTVPLEDATLSPNTEEQGIHIYEASPSESSSDPDEVKTVSSHVIAYLNKPLVMFLFCFSTLLIGLGIVLILSSVSQNVKKKKKEGTHDILH